MEPVSVITALAKGLTAPFLGYLKNAATNSKFYRDAKALVIRDNFSTSVTNIFRASIADAQAIAQLSDDLVKELIEDERNRNELFRWVTYGTILGAESINQLNLEPYIERYLAQQDRVYLFFKVIIDKMEEYKKIHWEAADLEMINRLGRLEEKLVESASLQKQTFDSTLNIEKMLREMQSKQANPEILYNRHLEDLLISNDTETVERKLSKALQTVLDVPPDDPNWERKVQVDENEITFIYEPKDQKVLVGLDVNLDVEIKIPNEYSHFNDMEKLIEYGTHKQIPLKFEVKTFKKTAGEYLLEKQTSKSSKPLYMIIEPTPFPVLHCSLSIGSSFFDDNVQVQIIEVISETAIRVSNKNQTDKLLEYEFVYSLTDRSTTFRISIPDCRMSSVKALLLYQEYYQMSGNGIKINLMPVNSTELIFTSNFSKEKDNSDENQEVYSLLQKLNRIENYLNYSFSFPGSMTLDERTHIILLDRLISLENNEEEVEFADTQAKFAKREIRILEEHEYFIHRYTQEIVLFDSVIHLHIEKVFPSVFIKDAQNVQKKLDVLDDEDIINVTLAAKNPHDKATMKYKIELSSPLMKA